MKHCLLLILLASEEMNAFILKLRPTKPIRAQVRVVAPTREPAAAHALPIKTFDVSTQKIQKPKCGPNVVPGGPGDGLCEPSVPSDDVGMLKSKKNGKGNGKGKGDKVGLTGKQPILRDLGEVTSSTNPWLLDGATTAAPGDVPEIALCGMVASCVTHLWK